MSEPTPPEAKKAKKPLLLIIAALVVAGGGGAAFMLTRGGSPAIPAAGGHGEAGASPEGGDHGGGGGKSTLGTGPIVELPPVIVNLNEPEGTRYLKASIAVGLSDDKIVAEVERLKPVIRDQFIRELSELNFRQTMGSKNKLAIKRRLLKRFNELVGTDAGTELFITEFIVQ